MKKQVYDHIINVINHAGGYIRTKELTASNISSNQIAASLKFEEIEKISTGLYRLVDLEPPDISLDTEVPISFVDISLAIPSSVICLTSAIEFYNLTTYNPSEITVAVPKNIGKTPVLITPPTKLLYWKKSYHAEGVDIIKTKVGEVKIYNIHKTVCDSFRYRNKIGEDIFIESLKNYFHTNISDIHKLFKYAKTFTKKDKESFTTIIKTLVG